MRTYSLLALGLCVLGCEGFIGGGDESGGPAGLDTAPAGTALPVDHPALDAPLMSAGTRRLSVEQLRRSLPVLMGNDASGNPGRSAFTRTLTDGTAGTLDHEDAHTVAVALSGYFFEKTVANLTTGESPASRIASTHSSATATPSAPSKAPPSGTVSRCDPAMMQYPPVGPKRPNKLATPSRCAASPSARIASRNHSRTAMSASE